MTDTPKPAGAEYAAENTDKHIWPMVSKDSNADELFITKDGALGINCGGFVTVKPIREWHRLGHYDRYAASPRPAPDAGVIERLETEIAALKDTKARKGLAELLKILPPNHCMYDQIKATHDAAAPAGSGIEQKIIGYINLYRKNEGHIEIGSGDLYDTADEAKAFNASEFDDVDGQKYLGVASVIIRALPLSVPASSGANKCIRCGAPIFSDEPVFGQPCLDCIWDGTNLASSERVKSALEKLIHLSTVFASMENPDALDKDLHGIVEEIITELKAYPASSGQVDADREGLKIIALHIRDWLKRNKEMRAKEFLATDGQTALMAIPCSKWPSHRQLENWITLLERTASIPTPVVDREAAIRKLNLGITVPLVDADDGKVCGEHLRSYSLHEAAAIADTLLPVGTGDAEAGWQDISTAPKDGTKIDLLFAEPRGRTINCYWDKDMGWVWRSPVWDAGELKPESQWDYNSYPNNNPTHWMRSALPPADREGDKESSHG